MFHKILMVYQHQIQQFLHAQLVGNRFDLLGLTGIMDQFLETSNLLWKLHFQPGKIAIKLKNCQFERFFQNNLLFFQFRHLVCITSIMKTQR